MWISVCVFDAELVCHVEIIVIKLYSIASFLVENNVSRYLKVDNSKYENIAICSVQNRSVFHFVFITVFSTPLAKCG